MMKRSLMMTAIALPLLHAGLASAQPEFAASRVVSTPAEISCDMTRAQLDGADTPFIRFGENRIYFGYLADGGTDQDAVLMAFNGDTLTWCQNTYDENISGTDSIRTQVVGLLWGGPDRLYAALRIRGPVSNNPPFGSLDGWLDILTLFTSEPYTLVVELDAATGEMKGNGSFFISRLPSFAQNTCNITAMAFCGESDLALFFETGLSPLRTDRSTMTHNGSGSGPFEYRMILSGDLSTAIAAEAEQHDGLAAFTIPPAGCVPPGPESDDGPYNLPVFTQQPGNAFIAYREEIAISVAVSEPGTYEWSLNGEPLTDGPLVSGSTGPTLTIVGDPTTEGYYSCVATNTLGATGSNAGLLAVGSNPCPIDLNGDDVIDNGDINAFVTLFLAGCP